MQNLYNLEAEESVLGAILIDPKELALVIPKLSTADFYHTPHGLIYQAMVDLFNEDKTVEIVGLGEVLEKQKQLSSVGGRAFIVSLAAKAKPLTKVEECADIIRQKSMLRALKAAALNIASKIETESDADKILSEAEGEIFSVTERAVQRDVKTIREALNESFERMERLHQHAGELRGVKTGFTYIDSMLSGLQQSDLVILAARPSMGKTALALDVVRNVASVEKKPVMIFSLEMSTDQLTDRMIASMAEVDLWKLRTGKLGEGDEFARVSQAMGKLAETPIYIDDSSNMGVIQIRAKAKRLQAEIGPLGLIVVDYVQLMEHHGAESRLQEITAITRGLKQVARELKCPVLALSQLNRAVEAERPPIPRLSHLRESGSIEQDADVVMFIYRPVVYNREIVPEERDLAEIFVAKHRNGPTGKVSLTFSAKSASFQNRETVWETLKKEVPAKSAVRNVSGT